MALHIKIISLGCAKNTVDSEIIASNIQHFSHHVSFTDVPSPTDILIINTCGFILDAKKESIDTILHAIELKKKHSIKKIFVTGCLSTRYLDELRKEIPEVDAYFTVHNFSTIIQEINSDVSFDFNYHSRMLSTPAHYAYLKIAEGCNRHCSYCAIPSIRGKYRSETIENLYNESVQLAENGVKELMLIAQDLTYYGHESHQKSMLAPLINKLSGIQGIEWIRLHYTYPQFFTNALIEEIANNPKICKYIDIPIQHISNHVLELMKRHTSQKTIIQLLEKLRKQIPQLHLRTTVMVGHPGETKEDFAELLQFIKEFRFEKLGAFTYSHEENTFSALHYKDNITEAVKKERFEKIMEVQQEITASINQTFIGTTQKVIIDRKEGDFIVGRTQFDSPEIDNEVLIPLSNKYKIGMFYQMKIKDAMEFDLIAK
jgi:ribosomal protein S12 methylthiotransferase